MYTSEKFPSCAVYIKMRDNEGNYLFDLDQLNDALAQKSNIIQRYAYIIVNEGSNANSHLTYIHMILQFLPQCPQCKSEVGSWFNISEEDVHPHGKRFYDDILYLAYDGAPPKIRFTPVGIRANFDVQSAIDYAIEQKKLEYIFASMLCGDDHRFLPCSVVEMIRNRLLLKAQSFFDSAYGRAELHYWIVETLFNYPF